MNQGQGSTPRTLFTVGKRYVGTFWRKAIGIIIIIIINAMVFLVVMYGYESWTMKKAEHRIDAFEPWCWRRLLRVP